MVTHDGDLVDYATRAIKIKDGVIWEGENSMSIIDLIKRLYIALQGT